MEEVVALTTTDNPYDYFTDFDHWYQYDTFYGYDCCGRVDRLSTVDFDLMSDAEIKEEIERAINIIIKNDFTGKYLKIKRKIPA